MDWASLFAFKVSPLELVVRGSLMYWFLFLMFRFVLQRDVGGLGTADVLLLVLVADAAQNAMAGSYDTVSEGLVLVSTLLAWNLLLDWASFRFAAVRRFVEAPPLMLIRRGRVLHRNMRREFVTMSELRSALREQGVGSFEEVRAAYMENDGKLSVLRASNDAPAPPAQKGGTPGAA